MQKCPYPACEQAKYPEGRVCSLILYRYPMGYPLEIDEDQEFQLHDLSGIKAKYIDNYKTYFWSRKIEDKVYRKNSGYPHSFFCSGIKDGQDCYRFLLNYSFVRKEVDSVMLKSCQLGPLLFIHLSLVRWKINYVYLAKCQIRSGLFNCLRFLDLENLWKLVLKGNNISNKGLSKVLKLRMANLSYLYLEEKYLTRDIYRVLPKVTGLFLLIHIDLGCSKGRIYAPGFIYQLIRRKSVFGRNTGFYIRKANTVEYLPHLAKCKW